MKVRIFTWVLLVFVMAYGLFAVQTLAVQRRLAEKTVRLHVVANSDSDGDQAQKLRVRDAVLQTVGKLTADCSDAVEARAVISQNLDLIRTSAQEVLTQENSDYTVAVSMATERFPTRYYDTFTLPAGEYPALRVNIGSAAGHNWWCVVFPSLCMAATGEDLEEYAAVGGLEEGETELITGGEEKYELRFKTLEWLQDLFAWLS